MKILHSFLIVSSLAILGGCQSNESIQTVEWYEAHNAEREEVLQECRDNPGEKRHSANCINAERAESKQLASRTGTLNIEPMTHLKLGVR
jgi:hypothetical protein